MFLSEILIHSGIIILYTWKKHFCFYYLHVFNTEKLLKRHIKDCFKINGKNSIIMPKKGDFVNLKNYLETKSRLMICASFESVLITEGNERILYRQIWKTYCLQLLL